jgi:uncharacterized membrane protein YedE/YeeE
MMSQPWPWYIAGPLIGLTVPALLLLGNKSFGISSSMRHICAACLPANVPFFKYDWKKELWNLFFVGGIFLGGLLAAQLLAAPTEIVVHEDLRNDLAKAGLNTYSSIMPQELFSWQQLTTLRGWIFIVFGGFLVGFGTRYAGGCTSGHAIMGLSTLQWPSLIATCCFMIGGLVMTHFILPFLLSL